MKKNFEDLKVGDKVYIIKENGEIAIEEIKTIENFYHSRFNSYIGFIFCGKIKSLNFFKESSVSWILEKPNVKAFIYKKDAINELKRRELKIKNSIALLTNKNLKL